MIKFTLSLVGVLILIGIILVVSTFGYLVYYEYFVPKFKEAERTVWENTPSRINGAIQEISKNYIAYKQVETIEEKKAICFYLRNSYPDITYRDIEDSTLWSFFSNCKYGVYEE